MTFLEGDATQPQGDGVRMIAHVCNTDGKWGAGFSGAISRRWKAPEMAYRHCYASDHNCFLGDIQILGQNTDPGDTIYVVNMIAQRGIRFGPADPACYLSYTALGACLSRLALKVDMARRPYSVHMPRIGAGLAGGDWDKVQPLIESHISHFDIPVFVYDYKG